MKFDFNGDKPIYKQLVEVLKYDIATGDYQAGDKLPSVREFSAMFFVNPNTVQRALNELEEEKLIITNRTSGKFVTDDHKLIDNQKKSLAIKALEECLKKLERLNISDEQVIKYIKDRREEK